MNLVRELSRRLKNCYKKVREINIMFHSMYYLRETKFVRHDVRARKQLSNGTDSKKNPFYYFVRDGFYEADKVWVSILIAESLLISYGYYVLLTNSILITIMWSVAIGMFAGISIASGAHMLWGHRSYEAKWPVRLAFMLGQTMSGQFTLYTWAAMHRVHHKFSDTEADPHDPRRGSLFAHVGWMIHRRHPEVIVKEKTLDFSDLMADPIVRFQKEHHFPLYVVFGVFIPIAVPMFFWNETLLNSFLIAFVGQTTTLQHVILLINSAAHVFGTRPFSADITAADNGWVSAMTLGSGYHNYHHSFPQDYGSSESGIGFNIQRDVIRILAYFGLAYNLKTTSLATVKATKERALQKRKSSSTHFHHSFEELPENEYEMKFAATNVMRQGG